MDIFQKMRESASERGRVPKTGKRVEMAFLDYRINLNGIPLTKFKMSKARSRVRNGLIELPEWGDDFRLVRIAGSGSLKPQVRHRESECWVTLRNKSGYTNSVVRNLNTGLWVGVDDDVEYLQYTCKHGFTGRRKIVYMSTSDSHVGGCELCLKACREPVFGTITRRRRKWEAGLVDPMSASYIYLHRLRDGSYIYGVSAIARLQKRMYQYKADIGYTPDVVHLIETTDERAWLAEEVLKKGVTKGLRHKCEASTTPGGRTEYLPEYYSLEEAISLINEAFEITEKCTTFVRP